MSHVSEKSMGVAEDWVKDCLGATRFDMRFRGVRVSVLDTSSGWISAEALLSGGAHISGGRGSLSQMFEHLRGDIRMEHMRDYGTRAFFDYPLVLMITDADIPDDFDMDTFDRMLAFRKYFKMVIPLNDDEDYEAFTGNPDNVIDYPGIELASALRNRLAYLKYCYKCAMKDDESIHLGSDGWPDYPEDNEDNWSFPRDFDPDWFTESKSDDEW